MSQSVYLFQKIASIAIVIVKLMEYNVKKIHKF